MSRSMRRTGLPLAVLVLLLAGVQAQAAHHEEGETAWDQAKATELAQQLRKQASEAYDAVYRTMGTLGAMGGGQSKDFYRLKDSVRLAKTEARHLANQLKEEQGQEETAHSFDRLMETVRDIRELGGRMNLDKSILDRFGAAGATLRELAPLYGQDSVGDGPPPLTEAGGK